MKYTTLYLKNSAGRKWVNMTKPNTQDDEKSVGYGEMNLRLFFMDSSEQSPPTVNSVVIDIPDDVISELSIYTPFIGVSLCSTSKDGGMFGGTYPIIPSEDRAIIIDDISQILNASLTNEKQRQAVNKLIDAAIFRVFDSKISTIHRSSVN